MKPRICIGILLAVCAVLRCAGGGDGIAGSGSSSSNARVVCTVLLPDGTPAQQALVQVRPADFVADTATVAAFKRRTISVTDARGFASIDSLGTGSFALEVVHSDTLSHYLQFALERPDSVIDLDTLRLEPVASVSGTVVTDPVSLSSSALFAFIEGTEHAARVESSGAFALSGIPQSAHLPVRVTLFSPETTISSTRIAAVAGEVSRIPDPFYFVDEFVRDTLAVRALLDSNGLSPVRATSVCSLSNSRVVSLSLNNRGIRTIPSQFGWLSALSRLQLDSNLIDTLPASFYACTSLTLVHLSNNQIGSLSSDIRNLRYLRALQMRSNRLTGVPPELFLFTSLETVTFYGNEIASIPQEIGSCLSLRSVGFGANLLSSIPSSIGKLVYVQSFHAGENLLDSLPAAVGSMARLGTLEVHKNNLTTLPAAIRQLRYIVNLRIAENRICNPPSDLKTWLDQKAPGWDSTQVCP